MPESEKIPVAVDVDPRELLDVLDIIRRAQPNAGRAMVAYDDGHLTFYCRDVSGKVPAHGHWPGIAGIPYSFVRQAPHVLQPFLDQDTLRISVEGEHMRFGQSLLECTWTDSPRAKEMRARLVPEVPPGLPSRVPQTPLRRLAKWVDAAMVVFREAELWEADERVFVVPPPPGRVAVIIDDNFIEFRRTEGPVAECKPVTDAPLWKRLEHPIVFQMGMQWLVEECLRSGQRNHTVKASKYYEESQETD